MSYISGFKKKTTQVHISYINLQVGTNSSSRAQDKRNGITLSKLIIPLSVCGCMIKEAFICLLCDDSRQNLNFMQ